MDEPPVTKRKSKQKARPLVTNPSLASHNVLASNDNKSDTSIPLETNDTRDVQDNVDVVPIYHDMSQGWHCCFGPIANMACGWPQGTCTAILTIIAVCAFLGGIIVVLAYGIWTNNVNVVLAVLAVLTNGFSFAFGHYLGKSAAANRVPETAIKPPTP